MPAPWKEGGRKHGSGLIHLRLIHLQWWSQVTWKESIIKFYWHGLESAQYWNHGRFLAACRTAKRMIFTKLLQAWAANTKVSQKAQSICRRYRFGSYQLKIKMQLVSPGLFRFTKQFKNSKKLCNSSSSKLSRISEISNFAIQAAWILFRNTKSKTA